VFAPDERAVYSYEARPNLAPLGAKPGNPTFGRDRQRAIALLRSFEIKKGTPGYRHLAPLGRSENDNLWHFHLNLRFANYQLALLQMLIEPTYHRVVPERRVRRLPDPVTFIRKIDKLGFYPHPLDSGEHLQAFALRHAIV